MSSSVAGFFEDLGGAQQRILREQAKVRWWYLVGAYPVEQRWGTWTGPFHLTDAQLYQKIRTEKPSTPGLEIYRLVYSPLQRVWIWDLRSESTLSSSAQGIPGYDGDPPTISGARRAYITTSRNIDRNWDGSPLSPEMEAIRAKKFRALRNRLTKEKVGVVPIQPAVTGKWPFVSFPHKVTLYGTHYVRAQWKFPREGVVAQYREAEKQHSRHLFVLQDGTFVVPHLDEENPDLGNPSKHFVLDVMKRPDTMTPLEASLRAKAPSL